jgi:2-dehydropantoate 2-reductase
MTKRIAVLGSGANGGALAADFTRAGLDVTVIDQWPANVEAMRSNKLRVRMPTSRFEVDVHALHLCEVATIKKPFDIVFVLVKAYDTRWAVQLIEPVLAADGLVVGVQNGLTHDIIAEVVGANRTIGCVIEVGGAMWVPGLVERDTPPERAWFALGAYDPANAHRVPEVAEILRLAGTVEIFDDVTVPKWMKLIVNAAEVAPSAVLNLPMDAALNVPGMRGFMLEVGLEATAVAAALGMPLTPILGVDGLDPSDPPAFLDRLLDVVTNYMGQPNSKTAMLQDWDKGRRSEVEHMNGIVVREGDRLGIPVPANRRVLELSRRIEAGELEADPSNVERLVCD